MIMAGYNGYFVTVVRKTRNLQCVTVLFSSQVTTAVLSITAKAKARAKKSEASEDKMEVVRVSVSINNNINLACSY